MRLHFALRAATLATLGLSIFGTFQGCATLTPVDGSVCGDGVVGIGEECDKPNGGDAESGFCGKSGAEFACLRITAQDDTCPTGLVPSGGRCLSPSADFGAIQTLENGFEFVAADDFDDDGQTDILYHSLAGLSVSYFEDGTPIEPAFHFDAFFDGSFQPSVEVNRGGARDLVIPNASRNGLGVFVGTNERSFVPVFQPSLSLEKAVRMVALPPQRLNLTPDADEPIWVYDSSSRFLRQLGVVSIQSNKLSLCIAQADGTCVLVNDALELDIPLASLSQVVAMDPLYVPAAPGEPATYRLLLSIPPTQNTSARVIQLTFIAQGEDEGAFDTNDLTFPLAIPDTENTPECLDSCALEAMPDPMCGCVSLLTLRVLALEPTADADGNPAVVAAALITTETARYVTLLGYGPASGATSFGATTSLNRSFIVETDSEIVGVHLADFDGIGLLDSVVSVVLPAVGVGEGGVEPLIANAIFLGDPNPAAMVGPYGEVVVGDINGDGYDDVLGNNPETFDGTSFVVFGGQTFPLIGAPLDAPGVTKRHVIADLNGDGVNDVVAIGTEVPTTPIFDTGTKDGEPEEEEPLDNTLTVMFGQPSGFPVTSLTFATPKLFDQVLPLKLQLHSPGGESADGIDDLAILLRDSLTDTDADGSLVSGDAYGFLSSPYYLRDPVTDALPNSHLRFHSMYGLPVSAPISGSLNAVAMVYFVNDSSDGIEPGQPSEQSEVEGRFFVLAADSTGQLDLDNPSENLGAWAPTSPLVSYKSTTPSSFAFLGPAKEQGDFGVRLFELTSEGEIELGDWLDFEGSLPELVTGVMDGSDGRLFLVRTNLEESDELGRVTITISRIDEPGPAVVLTSFPGTTQWISPTQLQVGEHVVDMAAFDENASVESVIDGCISARPTHFSYPTLPPADLNNDGLPDALTRVPMSWALQAISESVCEQ